MHEFSENYNNNMTSLLKRLCNVSVKHLFRKTTNQQAKLVLSGRNKLYSTSKLPNVYLVDEDEKCTGKNTENLVNKFTTRTHTCGELRVENIGASVTLCGWLEYQRMNKFVVIRDSYGVTQLLINETDKTTQTLLENIPFETIIQVTGTVLSRPKTMVNPKQQTGEIEVLVENLKIVNKAKQTLPFNIREFQKAKETLRMQYRYLDLRFPQMQRNLRFRSEFLLKMREFLSNNCFVDIETPTLFKATPGGAQEFIVPTRFPGEFYSLVQSPQQFKQTLMAGAIDRYYQVARCYRDEGSRSDRQPEFTQLDIEMSFTTQQGVMQLVEELLGFSWPGFLNPIPKSFDKISYAEAMELYGSDKPDVRFDFRLENCTELLEMNEKLVSDDFAAYCLKFPKEYSVLSKSIKEKMSRLAENFPLAKLVQSKVPTAKEWSGKMSKLLTSAVSNALVEKLKLQDESVMFLAYGKKSQALALLGKIRLEYANSLEELGVNIRKKGMHFLWVYDFPLFELSAETGKIQSAHHPFTAPQSKDLHLFSTNPLKVRALAYDLVLNGNEVGGGSIRIHDPTLQETVLKLLDIERESMEHLLEMLHSGCPPHGGIALGLDRLLAVMLKTTSIRDVIAFPKTFEGRDPLSGAPSAVSENDQKLYHIKSIK